MSQTAKTITFVAAAALVTLLALVFRPTTFAPPGLNVGQRLLEAADPTAADALEIVRFDAQTNEPVRLEVERDGDHWVIASHNDYPADAKDAQDRIRDVALKLMDTDILNVATELASDHALLGVIDPTSDQAKEANAEDIGLLVALADGGGSSLAKLVVGKTVQNDESQRFVRKAGESEVYVAKIDVDKLSSKFEDWIEPNLLDVNSGSVKGVTIKDYNFDVRLGRTPDGRVGYDLDYDPRMEVKVDYDSAGSSWKLAELLEARGERLVPSQLTDDEELDKEKLDDLKRAIDDLKIVNVESKPKDLVEGVKSEQDLLSDPKIGPSLSEKGYYPVRKGSDLELLSSNGEVRVQTDDGIEYILRFGRTAGVEEGAEDAKLNRYLLVSARVVDEHFQPKPPETTPMTEAPSEENPAEENPAAGAGGQDGESGAAGTAGEETPPATSETPAAETGDKPATETPPAEATTEQPPATVPPTDPAAEALAQKRKEADQKVEKLNKKFANWYYIISEDVYKKLHLGRFDIIKEKGESSFGLDELHDLPGELPNTTPPGEDPPATEQP